MAARFLIEIPHDASPIPCARAIETILKTGSHLLTHADWGCKDGVHKAWLIVEVDSREEARAIVPPEFRAQSLVVQLAYFSLHEIEAILQNHRSK